MSGTGCITLPFGSSPPPFGLAPLRDPAMADCPALPARAGREGPFPTLTTSACQSLRFAFNCYVWFPQLQTLYEGTFSGHPVDVARKLADNNVENGRMATKAPTLATGSLNQPTDASGAQTHTTSRSRAKRIQ